MEEWVKEDCMTKGGKVRELILDKKIIYCLDYVGHQLVGVKG